MRRLSDGEAEARARAAGCTPLEPYPGTAKPWRMIHDACGREVTPTLNRLGRQGPCMPCGAAARGRAKSAKHEAKYWRIAEAKCLIPLTDYPGSQNPWPVMCDFCGDICYPRPDDLAQGHRVRCTCYDRECARRAMRDDDEVAAEVASYGLVIVGRRPVLTLHNGEIRGEYKCLTCGVQVSPSLGTLRSGGTRGCSCDPPRKQSRDGVCRECGDAVFASGLCRYHYGSRRARALLELTCEVPGCGNGQHATGLCASHFTKGRDHVIGGSWGYRPDGDAVLYLIRDDEVWKYGKAMEHRLAGRLAQHSWHTEVVDVLFGGGFEVTRWEQRVRDAVRHLRRLELRRDGWQESHYRADFDPAGLGELLASQAWKNDASSAEPSQQTPTVS